MPEPARRAAQLLAWATVVLLGAAVLLWAICGPLGDSVTEPCPSYGRLPQCTPTVRR